ncbi:MAG: DMT family transporter [Rhizobiaceae bacterium]|nr:DMT family transporter [Rhizobiaceae bacterium]
MRAGTSPLTNPYLLLTITALVWGGNAVAGKLGAGHVSPFLLTLFRWIIACAVVFPFALPHLKKDREVIRKHFWFLFALGTIGFGLFNNLFYLALNYTTAINVAIEQASMPLILFILNYLLFRTRVTAFQLVGFLITLIGVAVTVTRGNLFDFANQSVNIGDGIMIVAISFYGIYSVFLQKKPDIHLLSFIFVLGMAALTISIPFTAYEIASDRLLWPDTQGWGVIVFAGLFPSLVSQLFWVMGLENIGSNRGGVFINLVPIFGALLAILILGEEFQAYHAVGLVLVLGGIALAQKVSTKNP